MFWYKLCLGVLIGFSAGSAAAQQPLVIGGGRGSGVFVNDAVLNSLGPSGPAAPLPYGGQAMTGIPYGAAAPGTAPQGAFYVTRPGTLLFPPQTYPRSHLIMPPPVAPPVPPQPAYPSAQVPAPAMGGQTGAVAGLPRPPEMTPAPALTRPAARAPEPPAPAKQMATPSPASRTAPVAPPPPAVPTKPVQATAIAPRPAAPPTSPPTVQPEVPTAPPPPALEPAPPKAPAVAQSEPAIPAPPAPEPTAAAPETPKKPTRTEPKAETAQTALKPPPAPPQPAPVETMATDGEAAPQTAAKPPAGQELGDIRLLFSGTSAELSDEAKQRLRELAQLLMDDGNARVQLLAYASSPDDSASRARRLSLSRALAVRAFLIDQGVRSTRMDVRALGNKVQDGPVDRVDILPARR